MKLRLTGEIVLRRYLFRPKWYWLFAATTEGGPDGRDVRPAVLNSALRKFEASCRFFCRPAGSGPLPVAFFAVLPVRRASLLQNQPPCRARRLPCRAGRPTCPAGRSNFRAGSPPLVAGRHFFRQDGVPGSREPPQAAGRLPHQQGAGRRGRAQKNSAGTEFSDQYFVGY